MAIPKPCFSGVRPLSTGSRAAKNPKSSYKVRVPTMIEGHRRCLESLNEMTQPNGEMCVPFRPIEQDTGYYRRTVRRYVRALARKGLAEYFKGLTTEEGNFAGAGYCITKEGRTLIESLPRPKINIHGVTTGRFSGESVASNPSKSVKDAMRGLYDHE